jgi:hypothetical protein
MPWYAWLIIGVITGMVAVALYVLWCLRDVMR